MRADCIYDIIKKFGCFSYDCILFDGPWGIGKTYAIDKALEEQENVCSISMFGLQNSQQIYHEVLCQFVLKNNKAGKIAGAATEVLDGISNIWKSVSSVKEVLQSIAREGMEFPIVIVDSLNGTPRSSGNYLLEEIENKYFHRKVFETREDIKFFDFWRLYYTAFSRAQNLLVLSCCEKKGHGATPSKYFEECYEKLPAYEDVNLSEIKLEKVKPVNIKDTYSFTSHIALYENCALQYKFFKELGFTQVRVGATLFGTLVHETIEDIHRAAMRHEEQTIVPETIREWFDTNYMTLSKSEHSYLGQPQIEAAYKQVLRYVERNQSDWSRIQDAEVEVSLVKPDYILLGKVDLIRGEGDTVEIVDFKSEKKPDVLIETAEMNRYRRQLEVYAHLIEEKTGKKVSKMHLYYTGEDNGVPTITFNKSTEMIDKTIKEFDEVVEKIQHKDFSGRAKDKNLCANCDMRHYCRRKGDC